MPKNTSTDEETWGPFGFGFGLSKKPTRAEFTSIAKYIAMILVGCVIAQWHILHDFLGPKPSKYAYYVGLALVVLSGFLLYRMLERHGLLKAKYEHHRNGDSHPDYMD
ncbi:MAG: hypothetical protein ABJN22_09075 [Litorimonas sp.]